MERSPGSKGVGDWQRTLLDIWCRIVVMLGEPGVWKMFYCTLTGKTKSATRSLDLATTVTTDSVPLRKRQVPQLQRERMKMENYKKVALAALVGTLIVLLIFACDGPEGMVDVENENGLEYTRLTIEGMPCILYMHSGMEYAYAGLTCDWSKHTGGW